MVWPTLRWRMAKEQNRTEHPMLYGVPHAKLRAHILSEFLGSLSFRLVCRRECKKAVGLILLLLLTAAI